MKIVAVNGSHRGRRGNTAIMVEAFLAGAREAGAETTNVFLAELNIGHCRACKACWFEQPGRCVIRDDMDEVLTLLRDAEVRVLASPVYGDNISGMLKVFTDRLMVTASPYWGRDEAGECRHLTAIRPPEMVMIANCGYPERTHFQVISHWIGRVARNMHTTVIGEIYAAQGALLSEKTDDIRPVVDDYLLAIKTAGQEIVTDRRLTALTEERLRQQFVPTEVYFRETQRYVDSRLKK